MFRVSCTDWSLSSRSFILRRTTCEWKAAAVGQGPRTRKRPAPGVLHGGEVPELPGGALQPLLQFRLGRLRALQGLGSLGPGLSQRRQLLVQKLNLRREEASGRGCERHPWGLGENAGGPTALESPHPHEAA